MPSGEKTLPTPRVSVIAELPPEDIKRYWMIVERCLRDVFKKSDKEAHNAVVKMLARTGEMSDSAALLVYHDSPLQIASILAGASQRPLTEEELLAYDKLWNPNLADLPSREQILQVHRFTPKVG
jgi:hypothetical protein